MLRLGVHDKVPFLATVYNWFKYFVRGRTNLTDDLRGERPSMAMTEDNVSAVRIMMETDKNDDRIYCYDPETKRQSAQLVSPFEELPTKVKRVRTRFTLVQRFRCFEASEKGW
ncbi:hypothetical protein EVAR_38207_1 [Eumeta japonica]|uniref:Mos1 transposase HTH domain-containing protein n=1 Tax=Eumeta variegata TaxID=151549 RepID=A0A4C1WGC9_EUMVA|nr:hypothetical protein EVAR_38207_1 [Eumeta japonica]